MIATGVQYSVRQFVENAAAELGITLAFEGTGAGEVARVVATQPVRGEQLSSCQPGTVIVRVDPRHYRPTEVESLLGDPTLAREKLGWTPRTTFAELVKEMVESDYTDARRDSLVRDAGFVSYERRE